MPGKPQDDQREGEMPSIPDGGLSGSMPDWLRRPPAWRTLPDREVEQTTPGTVSALPEADTSEIDPRTFIQDDDLPEWLRSLRQPALVKESESGPKANPPSAGPPSPASLEPDQEHDATSPSAFRPRRPPIRESATMHRAPTASAQGAGFGIERSWWERSAFTVALGAALLIAIVVIIVLVAA